MEGPPLGPGGEDITWPDQVAPRGRKASSTRKIKPQTSNLLMPSGLRTKLRWVPSFIRGHLQTWQTQYHYRDDQEYTSTQERGIQTCRQLQGLLKRVWILSSQSPPMRLWIARPNLWPNFYPDLKTRM